MDFVIHAVMLMPTYEEAADLWRTQEDMKMGFKAVVVAIAATALMSIYCLLVDRKNVKTGLLFAVLYGIATGIGLGYVSRA